MPDRFYLPASYSTPQVTLEGAEAHHLLNVLRAKVGDIVTLFDGAGNRAEAEILQLKKSQVTLKIISQASDLPSTSPRIILATAVPKGDRYRWLIEKATELNVSCIVPLRTSRSVVHPQAGKQRKMEQAVIAACKQSGRNSLLELCELTDWEDFLQTHSKHSKFIVADLGGRPLMQHWNSQAQTENILSLTEIVLCVGPEGGWTGTELELAVHYGAELVSLGEQILRIETAALVLAALYRDTSFSL